MILLEESWSELFLICAIQFCLPMDSNLLFSSAHFNQQNLSPVGCGNGGGNNGGTNNKTSQQVSTDLRFLSELVTRFRVVAVDPAEFACLKAIILFKSETRGLKVSCSYCYIDFYITLELIRVSLLGSGSGWKPSGPGASNAKSTHSQPTAPATCSFRSTSPHAPVAPPRSCSSIGAVVFPSYYRCYTHGEGSLRYV